MRRRIATAAALAVAVTLAAGATGLYYGGRNRFAPLAVALLRSATGLDVNFRAIRFRFLVRPAIQIDDGELISHGQKLVSFKRLTVRYHYRHLFRTRGLPLAAIVVEAPRLRLASTPALPAASSGSTPPAARDPSASAEHSSLKPASPPARAGASEKTAPASPGEQAEAPANRQPYAVRFLNLEKQASEQIRRGLSTLGRITRELDIEDGVVLGSDGAALVEDVNLFLSRQDLTSDLWQANFRLVPTVTVAAGALVTGEAELSPADRAGHGWVQGKISFVRRSAIQVTVYGAAVQARPRAEATVVLDSAGRAAGTISLALEQAVISGPMLKQPIAATGGSFSSSVMFTGDALHLDQGALKKDSDLLLQGEATLTGLTTATPRLTLKVAGLKLNLAQAKLWLAQLKPVPTTAAQFAGYIQSGRFTLEQAQLEIQIGGQERLDLKELAKNLRLAANVSQLAVSFPPTLRLPALSAPKTHLLFDKNHISIAQAQARVGQSALTSSSVDAELTPATGQARFLARLNAKLALGELYKPALALAGDQTGRLADKYVRTVDGTALVAANLQGRIGPTSGFVLGSYAIEVRPKPITLSLRALPRTLKLIDGTASIVPGLLTLKGVQLADGRSSALIDVSATLDGQRPSLRRLVVDLHQVELQHWLALFVKPKEATATASVDGRVSLLGTPGVDLDFSAHGSLVASPASVKLGILRSAIDAQTLVIELNGQRGILRADGAEFEGEKGNVEIKVPDVMRAVAQMDISVARLDLHSLKFVHFPGHPKPAPKHFAPDTRIFGHVKIGRAQVDRLVFSDVALDFDRRGNNWTVSNIEGTAYGGHASLNLKGRSEDEIIYGTTELRGIDVAWLLTTLEPNSKPVLSGRLDGEAKFKADTNDNFFKQTLGGKAAFRVNDGTAYRLKLLARVLSLLSVSGLLRGRLPDPFVEGIPFHVLKAHLTANNGVLNTHDLVLDGPVLRASAVGYIDLPTNRLNLTVGVMPFNMLESALSLLPLVGSELVGREGLLAIYVTATGSASDPLVLPAPITSVTKILKKILTLPANIINSESKSNSPDD